MTEGKFPAISFSLTFKKNYDFDHKSRGRFLISPLSDRFLIFFNFAEVGGLIEIGIACIELGWVLCSIQCICHRDMHFARPPLTHTAFKLFQSNVLPLKQ